MTSVAYPGVATLVITVIQTCSLMLNGPGFNDQMNPNVLNLVVGRILSSALPKGKVISWMIKLDM